MEKDFPDKLNMAAGCVRGTNRKAKKKRGCKETKYGNKVNVNHAAGIFKGRLVRVIIEGGRITRRYLMSELVCCMERREAPIRPSRNAVRKTCNRKGSRFHHNHKSNC
jgi:hypothetical protein